MIIIYYLKGLDNGYLYTKDNNRNRFKSAITHFDESVCDSDEIIIDGKTYYFGYGNLCADVDKIHSETNLVCTLANLALTGDNDYILCVNLPIIQYKKQREEFKQTIINYNNHEVIYKNKQLKYKISDVSVYPQGVCAIYSVNDDMREEKILFDIGSQTINVALFELNDYNSLTPTKYMTEFKGTLKLYERVVNEINRLYGLALDNMKAQYILQHGLKIDGVNVDISFIKDIIKDYMLDILSKFKTEFSTSYKSTKKYLVGGGAELLYPIFKNNFSDCVKVDDPQFANAKGLYIKGKEIYSKYL